ncbi:hypothetical protein HDF16_006405 [Granulicella aggregans]|uniref:DNA polymerase Y-family little finger domain-containing protein n=1 Tax=Granulicella aggregans TaxID=474949 RepID=A0A7W8E7Q9_9BACT|nr:hypothetical protein [Granulicella aggregans]MBB5061669.1 hypothetical protein [Granulicella aggregans]
MELQGESCLPLSLISPQREELAVTRTFGEYVTEWDELKQAASTFATRAGEKLRHHGPLACAMTVFFKPIASCRASSTATPRPSAWN